MVSRHCVGAGGEEAAASCDKVARDYNIPLRVGAVFIILATGSLGRFSHTTACNLRCRTSSDTIPSTLGAVGPILLSKWSMSPIFKWAILVLKQFGTGVIVSTAFVHVSTAAV